MQINTTKDKVGVYMGLGSCFWTNNDYFLDDAISEQPQKNDFVKMNVKLSVCDTNFACSWSATTNN